MAYVWQLRQYLRQTAGQLLLGALAGILMNTTLVLPSLALGRAVDVAVAYMNGTGDVNALLLAATFTVIAVAISELPRIGKRWWLISATARIRANLRADVLRGLLALPAAQLAAMPVGEGMARVMGDVDALYASLREMITETFDTLLFLLTLLIAMLVIDPSMTAVALLPVPFAMWLAWASGRWIRQRTGAVRAASGRLTAALQTNIAGMRTLRLLGLEAVARRSIAQHADEATNTAMAAVTLHAALPAIYTAMMGAGIIWVLWQGGLHVIEGVWTLGVLTAFLELFGRFTLRGFRIPQWVNAIQAGDAVYARLRPYFAPALAVQGEPPFASFRSDHLAGLDAATAASVPAQDARPPMAVSLRDVTFAYDDTTPAVLHGLTLELAPGAWVAVTGPVGSGKTALLKSMLGLLSIQAGTRLWDGQAHVPARAEIGYVAQEPVVFSGTLAGNVTFDSVTTPEQLQTAVARAQLADDVAAFPAGLQTQLGEKGVRVSGGQRQRIALARAMLPRSGRVPRLLLLDDPFSAVDVHTEARLIAVLREAFGPAAPPEQRATIVMVSHRLAAFPQADHVVVMSGGRVQAQGNHHALMAADGLYARIFAAQRVLGSETLA